MAETAAALKVPEDVVVTALRGADRAAVRDLTTATHDAIAADLVRMHKEGLAGLARLHDRALARGQTREVLDIARERRQSLKAFQEVLMTAIGLGAQPIAAPTSMPKGSMGEMVLEMFEQVFHESQDLFDPANPPTSIADLVAAHGKQDAEDLQPGAPVTSGIFRPRPCLAPDAEPGLSARDTR